MTRSFALALVLLAACAPVIATNDPRAPIERRGGVVRAGTPFDVDIVASREHEKARLFTWSSFDAETFARAKRERKLILLDGAAAWCHWCHVMDETTYLDGEVGALLRDRFVTIRADIDERPDLAERYGEWGWPATIVFSPDAEEIGKYRGYLPAAEMKQMLEGALAERAAGASETPATNDAGDKAATLEALPWVAAHTTFTMDGFYDAQQGSWGQRQKVAIGRNVEVELRRAQKGDRAALERALFTLKKQRALIDPVWGGVYQYSTARDWSEPHYEKLMPFQAENLEAYALGFVATRDTSLLADAKKIATYLNTFLSDKDGAFLVSQDADVNAHDRATRFVDGDVYYRKGDGERRALGIPRVDPAEHPFENGLAIAAFVTLHRATSDAADLARARRAADRILASFVDEDGRVRRDKEGKVRFLADAASFGRALVMLGDATGDARYRERALAIAASIDRDFGGSEGGLLFDRTSDPDAAGVFKRRFSPFVVNATAARFFASLAPAGEKYEARSRALLASLATPRKLDEQGRMLGEYLLALDEAGVVPW